MSDASRKLANGFADLIAASIAAGTSRDRFPLDPRAGQAALEMVDIATGRLASALDEWAELHILADLDEPETRIDDPVTGRVVVTYHCGHVHGLANGDQMLGALCPTCKGALAAATEPLDELERSMPGAPGRADDGRTLGPRPGDAVYEEQLKAMPSIGEYIEDSRDVTWRVTDYDVGTDSIVLRSLHTGNTVKYQRPLFLELWDLGAFHKYDDFGR